MPKARKTTKKKTERELRDERISYAVMWLDEAISAKRRAHRSSLDVPSDEDLAMAHAAMSADYFAHFKPKRRAR